MQNLYSTAALLLNSSGKTVNVDDLQKIFSLLGVDFNEKIAKYYCISKEKIDEICKSQTSSSAPLSNVAPAAQVKEEVKKEEEVKDEDDEVDVGIDDLFG